MICIAMQFVYETALALLSDGSAFNSLQLDLLPCVNGTESDRWPAERDTEQLRDAKREIWRGREGSQRRTGRNVDGECVF